MAMWVVLSRGQCPACHRQVPHGAKYCPGCGRSRETSKKSLIIVSTLLVLTIVAIVLMLAFNVQT